MPIHGYPGGVITANPVAPTASVATGVWTTEQQLQAVSQGNWPGYEYPISRSLRFNSADSAYLNRTPGSASNRKTWTWSGWVKKSDAVGSTPNQLFSARTGSDATYTLFYFDGSPDANSIKFLDNGATLISSSKYRDPSAWYHVVIALDTTQATSSNRVKIYVNGVQVTAFSTATYPSQNADLNVNSTATHLIGQQASGQYFNGYMTEVNFIDGQALTPSSFGLNDPETGVWSPKRYTGTYGTNGFYLNFSDNSGTTSTTLGKDSSGNGNNWTPNNFSVTAGAGNDSLVDSPTSYGTDTGVGGEVRGNYATLNPLKIYGANFTYSNGNLQVTDSSSSYVASIPTLPPPNSGKWYWEVTVLSQTTASTVILGLATEANAYSTNAGTMASYGRYRSDGDITNLAGTAQTAGSSYTTNDVIGVALDVDSGTVRFYKNGVAQGATPSFSFTAGTVLVPYVVGDNTAGTKTLALNFGQRAFAYTAPSGFKALCTQNLPTPTIGATSTTQANDYFDINLSAATGATRTVSGFNFQPDMVWSKNRTYSTNGRWGQIDSVRGVNKTLCSNLTDAEVTSQSDLLTAFNSDGFSLGADANAYGWNYNQGGNSQYAYWAWKANGAGSSNTAGTITSTVSANTTSGFSIVTYTGTGANATVGHGLGVAPSMVITKGRDSVVGATNWKVYHTSLGNTKNLNLNLTNAEATSSTVWNNTSPTSTVFSIGTNGDLNGSGATYVAYCFAPVAGYSAFGSYTGNGSTDGPFVYLGFRPRFLLLKISSTTGDWAIYDTSRNTYNVMDLYLYPNSSAAEGGSGTTRVDALSNGFKLRNSGQDNTSSATYIYAAFAETPAKFSLAR